jgi:hypothetical protein
LAGGCQAVAAARVDRSEAGHEAGVNPGQILAATTRPDHRSAISSCGSVRAASAPSRAKQGHGPRARTGQCHLRALALSMGQRLVITRREAAERAGSHPGRRRRAATPGSTSTTCASASWRLLGARAARARALAKAREQAAEEAGMVLGRLRGATSQQLGEAARRLGARLHRHQAALAAGLTAAAACWPTPRSTANGAPPSSTSSPSACRRWRPFSGLLPPRQQVSRPPEPDRDGTAGPAGARYPHRASARAGGDGARHNRRTPADGSCTTGCRPGGPAGAQAGLA